jgi:uncharacterized protein YjbI with pentapeptide repeats
MVGGIKVCDPEVICIDIDGESIKRQHVNSCSDVTASNQKDPESSGCKTTLCSKYYETKNGSNILCVDGQKSNCTSPSDINVNPTTCELICPRNLDETIEKYALPQITDQERYLNGYPILNISGRLDGICIDYTKKAVNDLNASKCTTANNHWCKFDAPCYLNSTSLTGCEYNSSTQSCSGGAKLFNMDLTKFNLKNVDFTSAMLEYSIFNGLDLTTTNFYGANLNHANFTNANLVGTNLENTSLIETNFTKANASGANLEYSIGYNDHTILKETNLTNANLNNSDLTRAIRDSSRKDLIKCNEFTKFPNDETGKIQRNECDENGETQY